MNCTTARELMSEHIDSLLDKDRAAQLRAHLDQCPDCRRELAALEKTVRLVKSLKAVDAPSGLVQGVRARLEAAGKPRLSLRPIKIFYPALALAAGLVLVLGAVTYFLIEQERRQSGFRVASVEHKQPELAVEPDKDEAVRSSTVKEAAGNRAIGQLHGEGGPAAPRAGISAGSLSELGQDSVATERAGHLIDDGFHTSSAEKDGRIWSGGDEKMKHEETLVRKEVGRIAADSTAEASSDSLAMSAPRSAQASGGVLREEAKVTGAYDRAAPPAASSSGAIMFAPKITQKGKTFVNLAITTTNRTEVEKVLLAFNGILFMPDEKRFKGGLKPQFRTAPGYEMKIIPAEKAGDVFFITLTASRWSELQDQLKSYGTISISKADLKKINDLARTDSALETGDIVESGNQLTLYVTIASP